MEKQREKQQHALEKTFDLRALRVRGKERGAPATAIQLRDIVRQVHAYTNLRGEKVDNLADAVRPASVTTFVPKDLNLPSLENRLMDRQLEQVAHTRRSGSPYTSFCWRWCARANTSRRRRMRSISALRRRSYRIPR
jgi:hypothetical protein